MAETGHSIVRQTVSVGAPDEGTARTLQPRLAGINETHFIPVIEQAFDEFDRPGAELLIDRIVVDLGTVPLDGLATVAAARLAGELRIELARLVAGAAPDSVPGMKVLAGDEAELAVLEHYLLGGLWPSWSPLPGAPNLDALVIGIAAGQPAALGAMLYRIGRRGGVLERLVVQLDETTLERLVAALEPEHAALIIGTIAETKEAHKAEPVTDLSEDEFADRLWLMTLNYLVAEPGTQFNRREFVRSLLMGMAEEASAQYGDILYVLRRALRKVERRRPLRSSLPAILLDLVREEGGPAAGDGTLPGEAPADVAIAPADAETAGTAAHDSARPTVSAQEFLTETGSFVQREAWPDWPDPEGAAAGATDVAFIARLADAETLFRRYDAVDRIARLLRGKVSVVEATSSLTADALAASLLELPPSAVRALLKQAIAAAGGRDRIAPRRNLTRLLNDMSRSGVDRLLGALMPAAMTRAPFLESVRSRAKAAADRGAFYAGVVLAALDDAPIDLDELEKAAIAGGGETPRQSREAALAAAEALLRGLPPAAAPPRARIAAMVRRGRSEPEGFGARDLATLIRGSFSAPLTPRLLEWLGQSLGSLDRAKKYGVRTRALLRAAVAGMARTAGHDAVAKRRAGSAAAVDAIEALLAALPEGVTLPPHRVAAIMPAVAARLRRRKTVDVRDVARMIRESLAMPVTQETAAGLRRALRTLGERHSARGEVAVIRDAVAAVIRDMRYDKALSRRGARLAALAAVEALLRGLPATMKPAPRRMAAILRAAADGPLRRPIDGPVLAGLIHDSLSVTITSETIEALRKSFDVIDRGRRFSARTRATVRDAIAEIAGGTYAGAAEPADGRADMVAAVETLLRGLPATMKPAPGRVAAILRAGAEGPKLGDAAFLAGLIRDCLGVAVTRDVIEALQHASKAVERGRFTISARAIVRDAIAEIAGGLIRAEPWTSRAETVAAIAALLVALPAAVKRPSEWIAALLLAAGAQPSALPADAGSVANLLRAALVDPVTDDTIERLRRAMDDSEAFANAGARQQRLVADAIQRLARAPDERTARRRSAGTASEAQDARHAAAELFLASGRRAGPGPGLLSGAALSAAIAGLVADAPARALAAARAGARRRRTVAAWIRHLPASALVRLTVMIEPRRHRFLVETAERLGALLQEHVAIAVKPDYRRRDLWRFVLRFAAAHAGRAWAAHDVLSAFIRSEVAPRLGRAPAFETMLRETGSEAPFDAAAWLAEDDDTSRFATADLPALLRAGAQRKPETLVILRAALADRVRRQALARAFSDADFAAVLKLLAPRRHERLLKAGTLLFAALAAAGSQAAVRPEAAAQKSFLLDFAAAQRGRNWSWQTLLRAFFDDVVAGYAETTGDGARFADSAASAIESRAEAAGMRGVRDAMKRLRSEIVMDLRQSGRRRESDADFPGQERPVAAVRPRPAPALRRDRAAFGREPRAPVYIDNAGLVLAAPFIPHLFRELGLLEQVEGGGMKLHKPSYVTRAIHLLQFLVTSRTATPEPLLVLNKIIVGVPTGAVVGAGIEATEAELALCDKTLTSMLANWPTLSSGTSVAGLQNTFMQREGRLTFEDDKWRLKVERKTLDVLVDQVPWGFRMIYHSWMPQSLQVEW